MMCAPSECSVPAREINRPMNVQLYVMRGWVLSIALLALGFGALPVWAELPARIYSVDFGWHTGLVVPDGIAPVFLRKRYPGTRWFVFGFGNRAFYMAPNPTLGDAVHAILSPSPAVIYVVATGLADPGRWYGPKATALELNSPQAARLGSWLARQFATTPTGRPQPVGTGFTAASEFYRAAGRYDAFHTCNTWVIDALAAAGLAVHPDGVIFAAQVRSQVRALLHKRRKPRGVSPAFPLRLKEVRHRQALGHGLLGLLGEPGRAGAIAFDEQLFLYSSQLLLFPTHPEEPGNFFKRG